MDSDDDDEVQEGNAESCDHGEVSGEQDPSSPEEIHSRDEGMQAVSVLAACCVPVVPNNSRNCQVSIMKENDEATKFYTGL